MRSNPVSMESKYRVQSRKRTFRDSNGSLSFFADLFKRAGENGLLLFGSDDSIIKMKKM